ncbi:hypothetical protein ACF91D_31970, partial [Staphylococcus sp. 231237_7MaSpsaltlick]|uniref:hypothetical protein n=1 Tax=Staphylococcus sp. 231237_7MaSpsaltlick TaxID=3367518 RepID=UPI00370A0B02
YIIPIGSTGYASQEILNIVREDDKYWYLKDSIEKLSESTDNETLLKEVTTIIQRIKDKNNSI